MTELPPWGRHRSATLSRNARKAPGPGPDSNENNGFLRLFLSRPLYYPCVCVWLLYSQMTINYARKSQQMIAHTLRNICKFATPRPTSQCQRQVWAFFTIWHEKFFLDSLWQIQNSPVNKHWMSDGGFLVVHNWSIIMPLSGDRIYNARRTINTCTFFETTPGKVGQPWRCWTPSQLLVRDEIRRVNVHKRKWHKKWSKRTLSLLVTAIMICYQGCHNCHLSRVHGSHSQHQ